MAVDQRLWLRAQVAELVKCVFLRHRVILSGTHRGFYSGSYVLDAGSIYGWNEILESRATNLDG